MVSSAAAPVMVENRKLNTASRLSTCTTILRSKMMRRGPRGEGKAGWAMEEASLTGGASGSLVKRFKTYHFDDGGGGRDQMRGG